MVNRKQATVKALLDLLQALPDDMLAEVLAGLGVEPDKRPERARDDRRCRICGGRWPRHEALASRPDDGHPWEPITPRVATSV